MNIGSLMKEYIDDCEKRSKVLTEIGIPVAFREHGELPVQPAKRTWEVVDGPERLRRKFEFKSLKQRALFVEYLLEVEEKTQHFSKIIIEGHDVTIEVWTHDLNRVTELDKEYASACDSIYDDVVLVGFTDYE